MKRLGKDQWGHQVYDFGPDSAGQERVYPVVKVEGQYDIFAFDSSLPMPNFRWKSTGCRTLEELEKSI